jgi:arginase
MDTETTSSSSADGEGATLRLLCPQWQGAGTSCVRALASEFPFEVARRGYAVGAAVLGAVLPSNDGPTVTVPITMGDEGQEQVDGVEAKEVLIEQLARALESSSSTLRPGFAMLGGECAVSVAPFSALAHRYGDGLAVLWIDSHPDNGTPARQYPVSTLWRLPR